ncbi:hypothetical protein JHQ56_19740 (plasmid) [Paenarthrobacter ureafaciens]|nr:hypothetical protein JHQ56_19740 [Paenarthrobacter ureafaciens]
MHKHDELIADFVVANPVERDGKLNSAVTAAQTLTSIDARLGILVTRHDYWRFSVALSTEVPCRIQERDFARSL